MSFALHEAYIILLTLLLFVEVRSIKDCCPKPLDPDAFRNVVSIYAILLLFLRVISIMRLTLAVYVCFLNETVQYETVDIIYYAASLVCSYIIRRLVNFFV